MNDERVLGASAIAESCTTTEVKDEKPAVLIIGGLGYVGRFLALHLHTHNLASEVRIVDKRIPTLSWLAPEFEPVFSSDNFMQANASKEENLARIFDRANGKEFDYVFNCGGETRYAQNDEVYKALSYTLSMTIGAEAAKRHVRCFVELSTGMIYKPKEKARKETDEIKPWSKLADWKHRAEVDLAKIEGLNLCILRLAHVYGPYTTQYLATALCLARVYKQGLNPKEVIQDKKHITMKWLWDRDLRTNTVHVEDAARAAWTAAEWYRHNKSKQSPAVFNIVDNGNTSQGLIADHFEAIFEIPMHFEGRLLSKMASMRLEHVVDDLNDTTLGVWAELQEKSNVQLPNPINPFMEKELLKDHDLSLHGKTFQEVTGFQYKHPELTAAEVESVIGSYRRMNWWPEHVREK